MIIHHHRKNGIPSFSSQSSSSQSSFHILHTWSHSHVIRLTPPHKIRVISCAQFFGTGVKFSLRPTHLLIKFRQHLVTSTSFFLPARFFGVFSFLKLGIFIRWGRVSPFFESLKNRMENHGKSF